MTGPKTLSLVIPCYNEERTLIPCIKRVLAIATTDLKLELVIVDDCSTDKSSHSGARTGQASPRDHGFTPQ